MKITVEKLITKSLSPYVVHVLLVPKKNGSRRICVDGHVINKIKIKYRFLILRLEDMLDKLSGYKIFSKLDLRSGNH